LDKPYAIIAAGRLDIAIYMPPVKIGTNVNRNIINPDLAKRPPGPRPAPYMLKFFVELEKLKLKKSEFQNKLMQYYLLICYCGCFHRNPL
jgi:hypothetical protein